VVFNALLVKDTQQFLMDVSFLFVLLVIEAIHRIHSIHAALLNKSDLDKSSPHR